jgi:hypothetical protein
MLSRIEQSIKKPVKTIVEASNISSEDLIDNNLGVIKVPLSGNGGNLQSYENKVISSRHFEMILAYSQIMHSRKVNGQVREIELVQYTLAHNESCMENGNQIGLINKRPYNVSINETLEVRGSTDHVMALTGGDFCPLTIEDKFVAAEFKPQGIAQVKTQMMAEIQLMKERESPYNPKKYFGILQDGFEWVFLYCFCRGDGSVWNRFHTPTTNVSECEK